MSDLKIIVGELKLIVNEGLPVTVDYDYDDDDKSVVINKVFLNDIDITSLLSFSTIETIEQNIFDSFDKELQEPDDEYVEG
tara:strand:+ start:488 stop:730 length:243 start_codon:yes stop_codon:yes gene_type:complete